MMDSHWLKEGAILQEGARFIIAQGPFQESSKPHPSKICFFGGNFFLKEKKFLTAKKTISISKRKLGDFLKTEQKTLKPLQWRGPSFRDFKNEFLKFQKSKKLQKIVPVFFSKAKGGLGPQERAFILGKLLQKKEGFIYGLWSKDEGFLGLTPEFLFKKKGVKIQTMALAATGKKQLLNDQKLREEHQIVLDFFISLKMKNFKHSPVYEWAFCGLKHLRSDISFETKLSFPALIKKLHPTPALGGRPRREALLWLQKNENSRLRKHFGAPLAVYHPSGESFCLVAIRNMSWNQGEIFLGVGCGWIKKSLLKKEWEEAQMKTQSVLKTLWGRVH